MAVPLHKKSATKVTTDNGTTSIKYHWTTVVEFDQDTITLDTNGYETKTTKARMNQASQEFGLGYQVYQENFQWYADYKSESIPFEYGGVTLNRN